MNWKRGETPTRFTPPSTVLLPRLPSETPAGFFIPTKLTIAQPEDLPYIIGLQKRHSAELGFLPTPALHAYIAMAGVTMAHENDEPCGYFLARKHLRFDPRIAPITQACIQYDAQRRHHGHALVARATTDAIIRHQHLMQCWCAEDIDANEFWRSEGFIEVIRENRGNQRKRQMILWRKPLSGRMQPWMLEPPPRAGWKAKTTASRRGTTHAGAEAPG